MANVRGIFGVREDEQVGMSLKLGWKFCSNETTGYQARKEMACITVGDWRLRLIELGNRFERIIFFPVYEFVYRNSFPLKTVQVRQNCSKKHESRGGTPNCPCGMHQLTTLPLELQTTWEDKWVLIERIVALYDEVAERLLGTRL